MLDNYTGYSLSPNSAGSSWHDCSPSIQRLAIVYMTDASDLLFLFHVRDVCTI